MTLNCKIEECGKAAISRGWCNTHYKRFKRHGDPLMIINHPVVGLCSIDGCGKPAVKTNWCNAHYLRLIRHGDPLGGGTAWGEPLRYLQDVVLAYDGKECLPWPYAKNQYGYGLIWVDGEYTLVTRIACEDINGLPPFDGAEAAHSCGKGNEGCCTKRHLVWKTHADNMADMIVHGTSNRGKVMSRGK